MKNRIKNFNIIFFLLFLLIPLFLKAEWLSDKKKLNIDNLQKNNRGYFYPTINRNDYPQASLLQAFIKKDTKQITITWEDCIIKDNSPFLGKISTNFTYNLYRSTEALSAESKLDKAVKIASINPGTKKYTDIPSTGGTYYYAISLVDKNNIEYFKPEYDQTYTGDGIKIDIKPPIVKNLQIQVDQNNNEVNLNWNNPPVNNLSYKIFLAKEAILTEETKNSSKYLALLPPNSTNFKFLPQETGTFYFCIVSVTPKGSESDKYISGNNTHMTGIPITSLTKIPKIPSLITDLKAIYNKIDKSITLNWKYRDSSKPGLRIYQNTNQIDNDNKLKKSNLLNTFSPESAVTTLIIKNVFPDRYYFAITSYDEKNKENNNLILGENSLFKPLIVPSTNLIIAKKIQFATNTINIYKTNVLEIQKTNFITIQKTNLITVVETNKIIENVTNIIPFTQTNINISNVIFTNNITNTIINYQTNYINLTNTTFLTNEKTITNIVTTKKTITTPTNKEPKKIQPIKENEVITLRYEISSYYRNETRKNKSGLLENIINLKKIELLTNDKRIKSQCILYIGRSYFYLGEYVNAYREFLKLKDTLPHESRGWLNRCLKYIR